MWWDKYSVTCDYLTFKHLKEIDYIVSKVILFQDGIDTLRSYYHLHFFFFCEIWKFRFVGFIIINFFFFERESGAAVWFVQVTTVFRLTAPCSIFSIGQCRREAQQIKATEDLGHAVCSTLPLFAKLLVIEHETNLASMQLQMPVSRAKPTHSSAPGLAQAERCCEGSTAYPGGTTGANEAVVPDCGHFCSDMLL